MHVTREQRVKAHVNICMTVLEGLRSCQLHRLEVKTLNRKMLKVQEVSQQQQQWLEALHCEGIVEEAFKKRMLELCEQGL